MIALGAIGIVYGSLIAITRNDLKTPRRLLHSRPPLLHHPRQSSPSTIAGLDGGIYQILNHGISGRCPLPPPGLPLRALRHLRHARPRWASPPALPWMVTLYVVTTLSLIGLPLLNSFVGEFLILSGTMRANNRRPSHPLGDPRHHRRHPLRRLHAHHDPAQSSTATSASCRRSSPPPTSTHASTSPSGPSSPCSSSWASPPPTGSAPSTTTPPLSPCNPRPQLPRPSPTSKLKTYPRPHFPPTLLRPHPGCRSPEQTRPHRTQGSPATNAPNQSLRKSSFWRSQNLSICFSPRLKPPREPATNEPPTPWPSSPSSSSPSPASSSCSPSPSSSPAVSRKPLGYLAVLATAASAAASWYQLHFVTMTRAGAPFTAFYNTLQIDAFSVFFHLLIAAIVLVSPASLPRLLRHGKPVMPASTSP